MVVDYNRFSKFSLSDNVLFELQLIKKKAKRKQSMVNWFGLLMGRLSSPEVVFFSGLRSKIIFHDLIWCPMCFRLLTGCVASNPWFAPLRLVFSFCPESYRVSSQNAMFFFEIGRLNECNAMFLMKKNVVCFESAPGSVIFNQSVKQVTMLVQQLLLFRGISFCFKKVNNFSKKSD